MEEEEVETEGEEQRTGGEWERSGAETKEGKKEDYTGHLFTPNRETVEHLFLFVFLDEIYVVHKNCSNIFSQSEVGERGILFFVIFLFKSFY